MNLRTTALRAASIALLTLGLAACDSIVGAECAAPYTRCGGSCVDLSSDVLHCGACGDPCAASVACTAGECSGPRGPVVQFAPDAGLALAFFGDAAADAFVAPSSDSDGGGADAAPTSIDGGARDDGGSDVDAALPGCSLGERLCSDECVDLTTDHDHCGDCGTSCGASEVCSAGRCEASCDPLTQCGGSCVDLTNDPDHCGACFEDCGSGICVDSVCEAALAGHLVVIGHDYERRRSAMSQLLANAVLLHGGGAPVRVLGWDAGATSASISGTNAAIEDGRGTRTYASTVARAAEDVPALLDAADSFLVYAQENASDSELRALGAMWSAALSEFLERGGVVVVLDGPSAVNAGTYQILDAAGLFAATSTTELVAARLDTITMRAGDPVLVGVPLSYRGEESTVAYATLDPDGIVESASGPVVFDRTITPR